MVENFGLHLKHERELRGVTLEEIAESTKIHIRFLEALESNEFDLLPGEVFIKGYIRSYTKVIGVDAENMVNTFDETIGGDRRKEAEKVLINKEKIRSRKKMRTRYVIAGVALIGIFISGYFVVGPRIAEKNNEPTELSPADSSTLASGASENVSNEESFQEENDGGIPAQETPVEPSLDETPPPPVNAIVKADPAEKPAFPPKSPQSIPENPISKVKETVVIASGPAHESKPSGAMDIKAKEPETSKKPAESEKESDTEENDVIIQYVAENPDAGNIDVSTPDSSDSDAKPLHLKIQVQGNSWFNIAVDGGGKEDFILPEGSIKNIYGSENFRVTIGNRRETHLFLNGQSIDLPPGSSDVIRDFDITAKLIE